MSKPKTALEDFFVLLVGALALSAIFKNIFDNDSSKIVSKEGEKLLQDRVLLERIREKIMNSHSIEKDNSGKAYQEVFINLDNEE